MAGTGIHIIDRGVGWYGLYAVLMPPMPAETTVLQFVGGFLVLEVLWRKLRWSDDDPSQTE